jgi:hypothetical protein
MLFTKMMSSLHQTARRAAGGQCHPVAVLAHRLEIRQALVNTTKNPLFRQLQTR